MSNGREDGRTDAGRECPRSFHKRRESQGRMRLKPKSTVSVSPPEPTVRPGPALVLRQRKELQAVGDLGRSKPENVESLAKYRARTQKYRASLTFSDEAGTVIGELMYRLEVDSPNEVVLRAIALLVSAQGKEILLRDLKTGALEAVEV